MADIRINQLPLATGPTAPAPADFVALDGSTTRKSTLSSLADVIRPMASQAEAEAGTNAVKGMSPLTTAQAIESIGSSLFVETSENVETISNSPYPVAFSSPITVTVGALGQFPTIGAALASLSVIYGPRYVASGVTAQIQLLSGFVMAEQVVVKNKDLGWITIVSVDSEVVIQRSSLTTPIANLYYPAFTAEGMGAVLPVIDVLFNMNTTGTAANRNGIFIFNGADGFIRPGKGVKNAGGRGLHVANEGRCVARQSNFSGAGEAGLRNGSGYVEIREANLQNCGKGLMLAGGSITDAEEANVSGSTLGIENYDSVVRFGNGIANNCGQGAYMEAGKLGADFASFNNCSTRGVEGRLGAMINLRSARIDGCGGIALFVSNSTASAPNLSATNAVSHAVFGVGRSNIDVNTSTLTGSGGYGVYATQSTFANAQASNTTGAVSGGFRSQDFSIINARDSIGTIDGTNIPNVWSPNGIVAFGNTLPFTTGSTTFAPSADNLYDIGTPSTRVRRVHATDLRLGDGTVRIFAIAGNPEGGTTAPPGSLALRTDTGKLYVKETGTGNTGWVMK